MISRHDRERERDEGPLLAAIGTARRHDLFLGEFFDQSVPKGEVLVHVVIDQRCLVCPDDAGELVREGDRGKSKRPIHSPSLSSALATLGVSHDGRYAKYRPTETTEFKAAFRGPS